MSIGELPQGWVESRVSEVLVNENGARKPVSLTERLNIKGNYPYYGATGQIDSLNSYTHDGEYILIGEDGANLLSKSKSLAFIVKGKIWVNNHAHAIKTICNMPSEYISYFINSIDLSPYVTGSAQPKLTKANLESITIPLPSLAEQQQIATKLDELLAQVDSLKTRLDAIPEILKRFRQSVLAAAVSGKLTEDWRGSIALLEWTEGELRQFTKKATYGTSAKSESFGKIPVLRMGNLQNGKIDWTNLAYTSDDEEIKKYKLIKGDVLFNRTNSPELVGKTSIFRGERDCIYAGYLIKVQCLDMLNPEYLNFHLNSIFAKEYCQAVKSDGVSQSNINAQKLMAYPISCPPIEEQTEIVRRVEQLFAYADQIEQRVKDAQSRVNHLTQSILAKAFRGELTAEWREQNPDLISGENSAEALLARIQAEREVNSKGQSSRKKHKSSV